MFFLILYFYVTAMKFGLDTKIDEIIQLFLSNPKFKDYI